MRLDEATLNDRFGFHPATDKTKPLHEEARRACLNCAQALVKLTPESREQSLAITALEDAMFWANAAIARHLASLEEK